ncbi:MAG: YdcF family protein, partial [Actinomycetota bacterium]
RGSSTGGEGTALTELDSAPGSGSAPEPEPFRLSRPWAAVIVIGLIGFYYLATLLDVWYASSLDYRELDEPPERRAAVVLGAAQYNGSPSPVLENRLDVAAELYENGQVDLVVLTGGGQEADVTTEAKAGYDYLRATGIPDDRLRLEVQGGSTYESLAATARFLEVDAVTDVVLVTDRYHARRTVLIAEEVGLSADVSLTEQGPPLRRLLQESAGVALGRLISFRRLDQL